MPGTLKSYQDYAHLVAYARVEYQDQSRSSATVTILATPADGQAVLSYSFGDAPLGASNSAVFSRSNASSPLLVTVQAKVESNIYTIVLEPIDFVWNVQGLPSNVTDGVFRNGQKGAIVELFGWPDADVAKACRSVGVRVYADAVINHMSGGGNDMAQHRREDGSSCTTWGNKSSSLASCVPRCIANYAQIDSINKTCLLTHSFPQ